MTSPGCYEERRRGAEATTPLSDDASVRGSTEQVRGGHQGELDHAAAGHLRDTSVFVKLAEVSACPRSETSSVQPVIEVEEQAY